MTRVLNPTLKLGRDESPESYVSRLAKLHGISTCSTFCGELGIPYPELQSGHPSALLVVAELSGVSLASLKRNALRQIGKGFECRGVWISRKLIGSGLRSCPMCLCEDILQHGSFIDAYQRWYWMLTPITACHLHGVALVDVDRDAVWNDRMARAEDDGATIVRLGHMSEPRTPSRLEGYVLERLHGDPGICWLNQFPVHAVVRMCEAFGAVDAFGVCSSLRNLSEEELRRSAAAGFTILSQGEDVIHCFLKNLIEKAREDQSRRNWNKRSFWGRICLLEYNIKNDTCYLPLGAILRSHIEVAVPGFTNAGVFGFKTGHRKVRSIRDVACDMNRHPKTIRKLLFAANIIDEDNIKYSDHQVFFDTENASHVLEVAKANLRMPSLAKHLGIGTDLARKLVDVGLIKSFFPDCFNSLSRMFAPSDIENFVERLFSDIPVFRFDENKDEFRSIAEAAKRAFCSQHEIVQLVLEKKIIGVRVLGGSKVVSDIRVDVTEIKSLVQSEKTNVSSISDASKYLRKPYGVVIELIEMGLLDVIFVKHHITRSLKRCVRQSQVQEFAETYASLFDIALDWGEWHIRVRDELLRRGIKPAIKTQKSGSAFYRRSDLQIVP